MSISILSKRTSDNADEQFLHVQVKDHGLGVAKDTRSSLFSYSHILKTAKSIPATQLSGGAGLGLYTLACRCAALRGSVNYAPNLVNDDTQEEKGSIFSFDIPIEIVVNLTSTKVSPSPPSGRGRYRKSISLRNRILRDESCTPCLSAGFNIGGNHDLAVSLSSMQVENDDTLLTPALNNLIKQDQEMEAITPTDEQLIRTISSSVTINPNELTPATKKIALTSFNHTSIDDIDFLNSRSLRILIVDDSVTIRKTAAMVLSKAGHEVTVAAHGQEAVQLLLPSCCLEEEGTFASPPFDVVLMDIQMPVMDGVTATSIYRQAEASAITAKCLQQPLLIIGMSACSDDTITEQARNAGMDFFMPKPFSVRHFLAIVQEVGGSRCFL